MINGLLTDQERALAKKLGECWNEFCKVVGHDQSRAADLDEIVVHIHALQQAVMSQAAARAYPDELRLLGGTLHHE